LARERGDRNGRLGHDQIWFLLDHLSRQAGPIDVASHPMIMHLDVTTVGPAERLKRLAESRGVPLALRIVRAPHPYRDLPFRPVLLRARRERPRRGAPEEGDELAPFHCPMPPVLPTERIAHLGTADCCIHPPGGTR